MQDLLILHQHIHVFNTKYETKGSIYPYLTKFSLCTSSQMLKGCNDT
jgi:hypothetical protein